MVSTPVSYTHLDVYKRQLLKGAATQAMQNLNLAFGFNELASIPSEETAA